MAVRGDVVLREGKIIPEPLSQRPKRRWTWLIVAVVAPLLLAYGVYYVEYVGPEWANRAHCANQVQQIGLAIRNYAEVHHCLPPAYTTNGNGRCLHGWRTLILPYLVPDDGCKEINSGIHWAEPRDLDSANISFRINDPKKLGISSDHPGGAFACFASGSPRFIKNNVDPKIVKGLITMDGGEDVSGFINGPRKMKPDPIHI
jgi:hypothetical protein